METALKTKSWPGRMHWNRALHRAWGGCSLHFWFLRLPQMYDRDRLMKALVDCAESAGAGAYAAYELAGQHDVLLRVWLPTLAVGSFADELESRIGPEDDRNYSVLEVVRHWVWQDGDAAPRECDVDAVRDILSVDAVAQVNQLSDLSHEGQVLAASDADGELLERLFKANAITTAAPTDGVRLVIQLSPAGGLAGRQYRKMLDQLAEALDALAHSQGASPRRELRVHEASMYRCSDRTVIVLCRVPAESWSLVRPKLLSRLAAVPVVSQTTTYPVLSPDFEASRERLQLDRTTRSALEGESTGGGSPERLDLTNAPTRPSVHDQLDRDEGEDFEAKGSAFTPLLPWLKRGVDESEADLLREEQGFFQDTIAKTVVAMLNTGGGLVMVGVLEVAWVDRQRDDRLRLRAEAFERGGRFYFPGLQDPTYLERGWDGFDRRVHHLLAESIVGEIGGLVRVHSDHYRTKAVALIEVEYPGMSNGFYLKKKGAEPTFYIRRGGSSMPLDTTKVPEFILRRRRRDLPDS
jgi:hypothetical protein